MYTNIKSCIYIHGQKSDHFVSLCGIRQGENLSPFLFSLFVNDLEDFLSANGCSTIKIGVDEIDNLMKLMLVMYADDTILLSDTQQGLQNAIDALHSYCVKWQLRVNCDKTKVVVFSKRKAALSTYNFAYNGKPLEITNSFKYLGLTFTYNGSFKVGVQELLKQGSRAMYALIAKCRKFDLPIDLQLQLFDALVVPILLYGCEVWGYNNTEQVEKLHLKFLKYVLNVKRSTCNSIVYGELGRYPLNIRIKKQMVAFWAKTLMGKSSKLSAVMLRSLHRQQQHGEFSAPWLLHVKSIIDWCGLSYMWSNICPNPDWLKLKIEQILKDQFHQEWRQDLDSKTSCDVYFQLKDKIVLENYLKMGNKSSRKAICQFRTNNSHLPKVTGRYNNIPRTERYCRLCDGQKMGDEFHLLCECTNAKIVEMRCIYLPKFVTWRPSVFKCISWLKSTSKKDIKALGCFLKEVLPLYH